MVLLEVAIKYWQQRQSVGVRLKCGSGCGMDGVKMRNGTDGVKMRNGTERNGYGVKMQNGTDMGLKLNFFALN
jgi:hypothetical protein